MTTENLVLTFLIVGGLAGNFYVWGRYIKNEKRHREKMAKYLGADEEESTDVLYVVMETVNGSEAIYGIFRRAADALRVVNKSTVKRWIREEELL